MAVRTIRQIGDPVLRRVSTAVDPATIATPAVQALIDDLVETMRAANGAGLAAPQIGEPHRIVALEVGDNPRYPYKPRIPLTVAINPQITAIGDETFVNNEGCLSVPLRGDVTRFTHVTIRYVDRHGEAHEFAAHGLTAGTWQHECDHLDGTLIVDRADPATLATWDEWNRHHRDAFVERITAFNARFEQQ